MVSLTYLLTINLVLFFSPNVFGSYTEIPPVKLLPVTSVAHRFPAAGAVTDGGYRTNIENGFVSKGCILCFKCP